MVMVEGKIHNYKLDLLLFIIFSDRISCIPGWPQIHDVAEADFELMIFLPLYLPSARITGIQ